MLLEIAIGDAYGAGFEYIPRDQVEVCNNLSYHKNPLHEVPLGAYTDDTQMTIAVVRALLSVSRSSLGLLTEESFAHAFLAEFFSDPRDGYARGFQNLLNSLFDSYVSNPGLSVADSAATMIRKIREHGRTQSNGAAMRACPIGLLTHIRDVRHLARVQARVTHTGSGVDAAEAVAMAVWYTRQGGFKEALPIVAQEFPNFRLAEPWEGPVSKKSSPDLGMATVRAAFTALQLSRGSYRELLRRCVAFTGDTDSVAAIAMGIASADPVAHSTFPDHMIQGLEQYPYDDSRYVQCQRATAIIRKRRHEYTRVAPPQSHQVSSLSRISRLDTYLKTSSTFGGGIHMDPISFSTDF